MTCPLEISDRYTVNARSPRAPEISFSRKGWKASSRGVPKIGSLVSRDDSFAFNRTPREKFFSTGFVRDRCFRSRRAPLSIFNRETRPPPVSRGNNGAPGRGLNNSAWPTAPTPGSQTALVNPSANGLHNILHSKGRADETIRRKPGRERAVAAINFRERSNWTFDTPNNLTRL